MCSSDLVEGSMVIAPVKVPGGGIYVGDVHAMMGDGEIAGHTADVSAEVVLEVKVIKGLGLDGPIVLPVKEDLPDIVRPRTEEELGVARLLACSHGFELEDDSLPVQMVGSGANLNVAADNALERDLGLPEVRNRCTITGQAEIGRFPGVVHVSMLVPRTILKRKGLQEIIARHYGVEN